MTVGFLHVGGDETGRLCAEGLVRSVRRAMPGVPVVHFADTDTQAIDSVDDVRRLPLESLAVMRFRHQAAVTGDWLFLDTDVIVQRDVRRVFHGVFHLAVTTRNWPHLKPAEGFSERMPFNAGVVFSRSPAFWREAAQTLSASDVHDQQFMGHQQIICDLVASGRYRVAQIKGSLYNCPPFVPGGRGGDQRLGDRMVREAAIVHYKGPERKKMLLQRLRAEFACA